MRRDRVLSVFLLLAGLGFAFLGQFYFIYRRAYVWDGVFFWCAAILAFGLLFWQERRTGYRKRMWQPSAEGRGRWLRLILAVGGAVCAVMAGWLARRLPDTADFSGVFYLWLLGLFWFHGAFLPALALGDFWSRLLQWLRKNQVELACLAALLLAALAVRGVNLEHIPANLGGDEGTWGLEAFAMIENGRLTNPFSTRWVFVPGLAFLTSRLSMWVLGESVAGLRALSVGVGTATVLVTFLLARELWGRRVAWSAAVALAFGHYHLHFSRLGFGDIADGLFVVWALAALARGIRSGRAIYFVLAGTAVGLGWYGYYGARLIGFIVIVYLAWRALVEYRFLARYGRLLALLLTAAIVVLAPLLFHYLDHPAEAFSRARQVNILAPGWIEAEKAYWGVSATTIYWRQFWKAISAFHYTLDPTYHYHASIPLLDFVSGVLFIWGMMWAIVHWRWPANGLVLIWFWLAVIVGWALTENPPSSHRLLIVAPSVALIVGLGLNRLLDLCRRVLGGGYRVWEVATVALLGMIAAINLRYYFVIYTPTLVYGNPTAEVATVLGRYLVQREEPCVVYFYAPPTMYWNLGNLRFLLRVYRPEIQGIDVYPPGEGEPPRPDLSRRACFVFIPERLGELEAVRAQYPGGTESPVYSQADGRLLYVMYEVSPP